MSDTFFAKGTKVSWKWGKGHPDGHVVEVYEKPITKTLKGAAVKRNGSKEDPAYLIEQDDGTQVLKLQSELEVIL